jgi:type VI secretion system protein ImpJ
LNCVGSPVLSKFLTELQGLLSLCSRDITKRLGGAPLAGDNALEDLLLLQAANRYRLLMDHFSDMLYLHPEDLYRTALQMVGELATLAREGRVPRWQPASYDHNDLRSTFEPVMQELRHCLEWRRRRVVIEIPIEYRGRGRYLARLDESQRSLLDEADFFLLARVREDRSGHFPDRCTISAPPELMGLVAKHLPGIALRPQRTVPPGLPFDREFTYFELQRDDVHWESFKTSSAIAFHVGGDQPGLMQLYAIRHE